ncbi:hypothetical protein KJ618_01135 [Patescibacteria group bacterium]|nr:hypothetical protein [Patescibacteria group bacterium]
MTQRSRWYFIAFGIGMFALAFLQDAILRMHAPSGYIYPYLLTTFHSKYYYLAVITEGTGPGWLVSMPYLITPHAGSIIHYLYFLLGKISLITGLTAYQVYLISRMIGAGLLIWTAMAFMKRHIPSAVARTAFFLYLLVQPWPFWNNGNLFVQGFNHWVWETGEAVRRIGMLPPHATISGGLTVLSLLLITDLTKRLVWWRTILAAILSFIAGIIYPMPVFVAGVAYGAAMGCWQITRRIVQKKWERGEILRSIVYLSAGVAAVLLLRQETAKGYPWSVWEWEVAYFNGPQGQFWLRYPQQLGILLPLALVGLMRKSVSVVDWFVRIWAFSGLLLAPFATSLHLATYRIIQAQQWLPLSMLAAYGVHDMFVLIRKRNPRLAAAVRTIGGGLIVAYFAVYTSLAAYRVVSALWPYYRNAYISPDEQAAISYLRTNSKPDSIIITDMYMSNVLPAFVRVRTVIGYPPNYQNEADFQRDVSLTSAFLSRTMPEQDARKLVDAWRTDFVYADGSSGIAQRPYTFLVPVYRNNSVVIERVIR